MAVFLPIVPNWQNGVRDTYEFRTDVFTARDGSEQRRSTRIQPRRSITAAVLLDGDRQRLFADAVNLAKDGKILVSDFSADSAILQTTVANGATILNVDRIPTWLSGGMNCALLTGRRARKISVDHISGNDVYLSAGVVGAVGQGAQLLPLIAASLAPTNTLSIYTTMVSTSSLTVAVEPGAIVRTPDALPFDGGPISETTQVFGPAAIFYGRYVLLRKPNYLQQPQLTFSIPFQTVDYERGVTKRFTPVPIISRTLSATYLAVSHADALALLDIFIRAKGRAGEVFIPTWGSDFPPVTAVGASSLRVAGTDFFDTYHGDQAHKTILIRTKDGRLLPREIVSMSNSGGYTTVTCDTALGLTLADVDIVSWMFVARFASDALTIDWRTNGVANVVMSFVTLANLAAEDSFGNNWILATGYWRDGGVWQDGSAWID